MKNVSNAFRAKINNGSIPYITATLLDVSNNKAYSLEREDFTDDAMNYSTATSSYNSFDLGSVIIGQLTLNLNNRTHKFDELSFQNMLINNAKINLDLDNGTTESISLGGFIVDEKKFNQGTITLVTLDKLALLDNANNKYSSGIARQLVTEIASNNGMSVNVVNMMNSDLYIEIPEDLEYTDRQLLSYILQLTCNYAKCDNLGNIVIKWYEFDKLADLIDAKTFDNPAIDIIDAGYYVGMTSRDVINAGTTGSISDDLDVSIIFNAQVDIDDVVITGVKVVDNNENEYLSGSDGYVIKIESNPLVSNNGQDIADRIASVLVGTRFRPMTATILNNPMVEAGDVGFVTINGNTYTTIFTNIDYSIDKNTNIACYAESASANSSDRLSQTVVELNKSKQEMKKQLSDYDISVQLLTNLMSQSFGIFKSEIVQEDGSTIYYMHNKPTLAESATQWKFTADGLAVSTDYGKTWNAGITAEGNAVVNVLSAIGITADWIKAGTIEGRVVAKNLEMQGGGINIETSSDSKDIINLKGAHFEAKLTPGEVSVKNDSGFSTYMQGQLIGLKGANFTSQLDRYGMGIQTVDDDTNDLYLFQAGKALLYKLNNTTLMYYNPDTKVLWANNIDSDANYYNYSSDGLSYTDNAIYQTGGYMRVGNRVYVDIRIKAAKQLTSNDFWTICAGLPIPTQYDAALSACQYQGLGTLSACVDGSGILSLSTGYTITANSNAISIVGSYICRS